MRSLVVVTAGLSVPSSSRALGVELAESAAAQVSARGESANITVIELRELAFDLATAMTSPGLATPQLDKAHSAVHNADGLITVSPIFQANYAGLFKMFCDTLAPGLIRGLPTIIGATAGSSRHLLALDHGLRPLMTYLGAMVVPTGVFRATEDSGTVEGARIESRIARAAEELANLMVAQPNHSQGLTPAGDNHRSEGDFTPLGDLLSGSQDNPQ